MSTTTDETEPCSMITLDNDYETIKFKVEVGFGRFKLRQADTSYYSARMTPPGHDSPVFSIRLNKDRYFTRLYINTGQVKSPFYCQCLCLMVNTEPEDSHLLYEEEKSGFVSSGEDFELAAFETDFVNGSLVDGKVTFLFEFTFNIERNNTKQIRLVTTPAQQKQYEQLAKGLGDLLANGTNSDLTIVTVKDGQEFKLHRAILSMRSPVFAAMFEHDTKERREGRVEISDVHSDMFQHLLNFIYTGQVPAEVGPFAAELLPVADKYQIEELKAVCERSLICQLSIENVRELALLGDRYSAPKLKQEALKYFRNNFKATIDKLLEDNKESSDRVLKAFYELSKDDE